MSKSNLSTKDKVIKCKLSLSKNYPFYSEILYNLNPCQTKSITAAAIDSCGNMYYNPEWFNILNEKEIKGLIIHEALHLLLMGHERIGERDSSIWNTSQDVIINHLIQKEIREKNMGSEISLPNIIPEEITRDGLEKELIIPEGGSISIGGVFIEDIDDETSESIYDKIYSNKVSDIEKVPLSEQLLDKENVSNKGKNKKVKVIRQSGESVNINVPKSESLEEKKKDPEMIYRKAKKKERKERGETSSNIEEIIEETKDSNTNWKKILHSELGELVRNQELDWRTPHKKSHEVGVFMPDKRGNRLEINVAIDTSGSISKENLKEFMGEVLSIINSNNNVNLRIIQHDSEVKSIQEYKQANSQEIVNNGFKVEGRGGTDHKPVFNELKKPIYNEEILILFTDGFTKLPNKKPHHLSRVIWVLNNYKADKEKFFGEVLICHPEESS